MEIKPSTLLYGTDKYIKFVSNCVIAKEGPTIFNKLDLSSMNISYDSVFTTRQTIASNSMDQPIMYGFLGTDITFLLVKPNYDTVNPQTCSSGCPYLEFWYEDEPLVRRYIKDLLVLTGNRDHRIPQIYLYNPNGYSIYVDIMAANLDPNIISATLAPQFTEITGLAFSSIITDQIYGIGYTGSTQFEILDISNNTQMVIEIDKIDIINIAENVLTIYTMSNDPIKLTFLSSFNAQQALSKMNWVMEDSNTRFITKTSPGLDTTSPTITWTASSFPIIMNTLPITKSDIRFNFITSVIDYDNNGVLRDGIINRNNVNVVIVDSTSGEELTAVTSDGNYSITFTIKDIATNMTSATKTLLVDSVGPVFWFYTGLTNTIDIITGTTTSGIVTVADIKTYFVNYVFDAVDGLITSYTTAISSGATTGITAITYIGDYTITFSAIDTAQNTTTETKTLYVVDTVAPVITYNSGSTGSTFTMSITGDTISTTGITEADIRTFAVSAITDAYDGVLSISDLTVSGTTYPITVSGTTYDLIFIIEDSSGNATNDEKTLDVIT